MITKSTAFTIIEVLVTCAIILVLAFVIFAAFQAAKARSLQTSCASNLRQIYTAAAQYAQDYDGLLPPFPSQGALSQPSQLVRSLNPYCHDPRVWRCPADHATNANSPTQGFTSYIYHGFHYNGEPYASSSLEPIHLDYMGTRFTTSTRTLIGDFSTCPVDVRFQYYNHNGRWNRIFLDGHAKSYGLDCSNYPMIRDTP